MKEIIRRELEQHKRPELKKLALTECLQHLILQSLYRHGFFENLIFTGGTALRILYHTGRFSEDLDFSLARRKFRFSILLDKIQKDLALQQFAFESYPREEKNVAKAELRFPGVLQEFRLSPLQGQKLTVKLEVDTHPPAGGNAEMALVAAPISYMVSVFDLPSLFATKLHAIFFRGFTKGRDYYDLMWYLGKRVRPNFTLLNHAIHQTEGSRHEILENEFKEKLLGHLKTVDFKRVRQELNRFILNPEEIRFFDYSLLENLIGRF